jgi:hypothetical protein
VASSARGRRDDRSTISGHRSRCAGAARGYLCDRMSFSRRHHPNPAREQWDRAERWLGRLLVASTGRGTDVEDYALVVLHYCWTMHDWLIKGLQKPSPRSASENLYAQAEVETLFQSHELRACHLLATAAKHLDFDPKKHTVGAFDGLVVHEWDYGTQGPRLTALAKGEYDLLTLCEECMAQVRCFLLTHGWQDSLPIARLVPEIVPT